MHSPLPVSSTARRKASVAKEYIQNGGLLGSLRVANAFPLS